MGQENINVDFIEFFANIVDGEFFKGVHRNPLIRVEVAASARIIPPARSCLAMAGGSVFV